MKEEANGRRDRETARLPGAFYACYIAIAVLFLLAVLTQAVAQVTNRDATIERANTVWMIARSKEPVPHRGSIYSSDEMILAQSQSKYDFWVFFDKVPCTQGFFMELAEAAGISEASLSAPFGAGKKRVWLAPLDPEHYAKVVEVKRKWSADGVSLEELWDRVYTLGPLAVGVVGWTREGVPMSGIERSFDKKLSGTAAASSLESPAVLRGQDVVLTIDAHIQRVAANAIRNAVELHSATSGSAIVIVPSTGDILAMADWPSFDPATGPTGGSERAVSYMEDLEPGSTFKVLTLAKALDKGVVGKNDSFKCEGFLNLGSKHKVQCDLHNGTRAHGEIGLDRAIGKSCNVSAARWALKVGREDMLAYLRGLGLLSKPDLGLINATKPLFDFEEWDKERQLATLGFGQSIAVPPVSLAAALGMIANDGEYVAPRLVSQVGPNRVPARERKRLVSKESAREVRRLMESVVQEEWGTGADLAIPGIRISGKTGTAQKVGQGDGNVSSFVGMFPAENPLALILVIVNDPTSGEFYGSLVAGPAFDEIAYAVIERLKIPRSSPGEIAKKRE